MTSVQPPVRYGSKPKAVDRLSVSHMKSNGETLFFVRTLAACTAGAAAGILGCTGWAGLAFYIIVWLIVSAGLIFKTGFHIKPYFMSPSALTLEGLTGGLMSFVLFWTLCYDIVYIY